MSRISAHRRLSLLAATALAATVAATLAFAGAFTVSQGPTKTPVASNFAVDDTRPQGPSDPPGLVGVPVSAAAELAGLAAKAALDDTRPEGPSDPPGLVGVPVAGRGRSN